LNKPKDYYVASVECGEMKAFNGKVMTEDGTVVWLAESEGYPQVSRSRRNAQRFDSPEEIKACAADYDGMPWYYRFKPGTLRIFKMEHRPVERVVYEPTEVEVK
jgi:hypothetical protein